MKNRFEIGEAFETTVVAVTDTTVFVDLNAKSEGLVDAAEFSDENGKTSVKEGDKITVFFAGETNDEMHFTTKIAGNKSDTTMLENAYKGGIPVEGHVQAEIKGGYEIKLGNARAFCPYSQMGFKNREEPAKYVGKNMTFLITEYKNDGKDILVSNRKIGESEYASKLGKLASQITEGAIVQATVQSLEKFGAFVDILGFRALLPISEISLDRVTDVSEYLEVGQEIKVQVLKTDWKNERVSVSLKSLMADPWQNVNNNFPVGTKIDGKISRIADFGLFVNLDKGVDGLVHISELENISSNTGYTWAMPASSRTSRMATANTNLHKVYNIGQKMSVVVEKIDLENKRISLVPATSKEQDETAAKYLSNQDDEGENYNPFAALLKKYK